MMPYAAWAYRLILNPNMSAQCCTAQCGHIFNYERKLTGSFRAAYSNEVRIVILYIFAFFSVQSTLK